MGAPRDDSDRRRELKLCNLRYEADRVRHARNLLRIELAQLITRTRSWSDPEAVALKQAIAERQAEWLRFDQAIRATLQEVA